MIKCSITLLDNNEEIAASELIEKAFSGCSKIIEYKNYDLIREEIIGEDGKSNVRYKRKASNSIDDLGFTTGVYFIISSDKNKLLYFGKSISVKNRLKAHLIEKAESVSSEMFKINDYLKKTKTNCVFYYVLETQKNNNSTIEGVLIDYAIKQRYLGVEKYSELFSDRID